MRADAISISLLLSVLLCVASVARSSSSLLRDPFLGISPQDEMYYKSSSSEIKCKDGSNKFSKAQLNDDFCDCPDGTDEPGTSACPNGKFYCHNAGHVPQFLFSSRVNDGICDCCDGSDEYDGKVKCSNTCWEAGKAARDKLKKKIATYKEGVIIRKQEIEQAKVALQKDEVELTKLKSEEKILKGLVQQLKDRKEQIEKMEEKERLQKEKEEKERKEAELAAKGENGDDKEKKDSDEKVVESTNDDLIGNLEDSSLDQEPSAEVDDSDILKEAPTSTEDQHLAEKEKEESLSSESTHTSKIKSQTGGNAEKEDPDEVKKAEEGSSEKTEELSREELGRLVASRWTGEKTEKPTEAADSAKDGDQGDNEETSKDSRYEEDDGYATESDDDTGKYDDNDAKYDDNDVEDEADDVYEEYRDDSSSSYKSDVEDDLDVSDTTTTNPSWLEKIQRTVKSILQAVNLFQTPVDKSEADLVRKEYEESSSKLSKMQSRISSLEKKLKQDFGPEKEFYSFYGRCFENKQNKYTYKVCPYKEASQVEGYSTTRLGQWDKFEDSYQFMVFSNGDRCWNGPDRSLKVKLRCGLKNEVTDVDEPSRCEYVALLSTPARCLEDKLKELEQKLDLMNQEQPQKHDEL